MMLAPSQVGILRRLRTIVWIGILISILTTNLVMKKKESLTGRGKRTIASSRKPDLDAFCMARSVRVRNV